MLQGATEHFEEVGAEAFSMRGAARRSGVTAAALYHHFEDRSELLESVVEVGFDRLLGYLRASSTPPTPGERLRAGWRAYVDFAVENPRFYEHMFLNGNLPSRGFSESLARGESPTFQHLVRLVEICMEAGELRRGDRHRLSLLIWSAVHGLCSVYLAGRFEDDAAFREIADDQMELLLSALGPGDGSGAGDADQWADGPLAGGAA